MIELVLKDANISAIINLLEDKIPCKNKKEIWFRGQANYCHGLIPNLFRHKQNEKIHPYYDESGMCSEFVRRYPEHSSNHLNIFEWLTLMQHYGLPTRLLDWSTNLLIALFFCCNDDKDKDGAVFAFIQDYSTLPDFGILRDLMEILVTSKHEIDFYDNLYFLLEKKFGEDLEINAVSLKDKKADLANPGSLNMNEFNRLSIKIGGLSNIYEEGLSSVIPYKPPHLNPRIRQQHGCFTFHGGKYFGKKEAISFNELEINRDLIKIRVESTDKKKLLKELALSGISEATLYPEMEYQTKQIKELYQLD